ncbi:hypothetical protein CY35_14G104900 [Sphagnum magellanicum]|nr:hypothetical protein CY35_14G104900 [Sphagnum magellanicum]KAH9542224.1 hypothetical protein CY35_14G104900 [Sphagnum magellanicum]
MGSEALDMSSIAPCDVCIVGVARTPMVVLSPAFLPQKTKQVEIPGTKGKPPTIVDRDDGIDKLDAAKLRKLRPVFKDVGFVTAGNSSSIRMGSDGAVGLVLASGAKARGLGLHVIAKLRGYADADQAPELFTMSPALAILKATASPGIEHSQVNF